MQKLLSKNRRKTITLIQYPNIKARISDDYQSLENFEISTVVFDDNLLSKPANNIDLFTRRPHNNIDEHYQPESYFHLPKTSIRKISNIHVSFKQTLRDVILLFHDIAGLDLNLQDWKSLRRKAWVKGYD